MMNYFHWSAQKAQSLRRPGLQKSSRYLGARGQALVEYILLLVISVILVIGMTVAFFSPLQNFLAKLNDSYIRCLLETGELPKLRSDSGASCDAEFPTLEMKSLTGVPLNNANGKKNSGNMSENQNGQSSSADGSGGYDSNGSTGGLIARNRKSSMIRNGMRVNGTARPEQGASKTTSIPVDRFEAGEGFMSVSSNGLASISRPQKTKKINIAGLTEYERKKIEREQQKTRTIATDSETFTQKKNKKLIVKPPEPKSEKDQEEFHSDFSFYFKALLVIGMILLIVILLGGQVMQMTNNSD